ncbi:MAG: thiamine pyrophosphate-dependent dehydrogenase E1 component subunit alpha [Capsulimonadaceae bacterium]
MAASPTAVRSQSTQQDLIDSARRYDAHTGEFEKIDPGAVITALGLSDDDLLVTMQKMLTARYFEEQCNRAFRTGKVGGYLHLYSGQEAISLAISECWKHGDQALSSYRDHAHCLFLGSDPHRVMAEIYGRSTGISRGKGGSMHLFDKQHGFAGGYGIVGGHVPIAIGIGWALRYKKELRENGNICVCYLGDGSMNAGGFHEALNMAQLYRLPVFFVLENNKYAMGTSVERSSANTDLSSRACSYAMPNSKVDGQDYFAVLSTVNAIITQMREDRSPYFLEAVTYRYSGHGAADGAETQKTYRTQQEIDYWKRRDPIILLSDVLRSRGILDEAKFEQMEQVAIVSAKSAADFADHSPICEPHELTQDVYAL